MYGTRGVGTPSEKVISYCDQGGDGRGVGAIVGEATVGVRVVSVVGTGPSVGACAVGTDVEVGAKLGEATGVGVTAIVAMAEGLDWVERSPVQLDATRERTEMPRTATRREGKQVT